MKHTKEKKPKSMVDNLKIMLKGFKEKGQPAPEYMIKILMQFDSNKEWVADNYPEEYLRYI